MEWLIEYIIQYATYAHWFVFGAIILAGMNIPISADLMVIISAILAATVVPEHLPHLFLAIFLGCALSAWIAYWLGRIVGPKLAHLSFFKKLLTEEKIEKVRAFYEKYGLWTLIVGRFIPFGVRNCIFMSTGLSKLHFGKFVMRDALACLIWSSATFFLFYTLGKNYQLLYHYVKTFNILIFIAFGVTIIALLWYKKKQPKING